MEHEWTTNNGEKLMHEQEFEQGRVMISDDELRHAITKLTLRSTVTLTA